MRKRRSKKVEVYDTNDAIFGYGEVPAIQHNGEEVWALPGGGYTKDKDKALFYARRMDRLIRANQRQHHREMAW